MNNDVHGLWVNGNLPQMALLTCKSFVKHHGHFNLWTYGDPRNVPDGVHVRDARDVLPETDVFEYTDGPGRGSVSGFSDIFRAALLHRLGGWWIDMDVTLLRPMPDSFLDAEIVLREHWNNPVVGNLMKFPQNHPVMNAVYHLTAKTVRSDNKDWEKPLRMLSYAVTTSGLCPQHRYRIGHQDEFIDVLPFLRLDVDIPKDWWAMHWCNEMFRRKHEKIQVNLDSAMHRLLDEYDLHGEVG